MTFKQILGLSLFFSVLAIGCSGQAQSIEAQNLQTQDSEVLPLGMDPGGRGKLPMGPPPEFSRLSSRELFDLWNQTASPIGAQRILGTYSAGCLFGATAMPLSGPGYRQMEAARNKFYGHRDLIAFLKEFGQKNLQAKLGELYLADLGPPRGGPMMTGHNSHQIGLDVDIRFDEKQNTMVDGNKISSRWTQKQVRLLAMAASDARVERIFVNPIIKKEVCKNRGAHKNWIYKLRPWWGHDEHFHVRLHCPKNELGCLRQNPVDQSEDSCEKDLAWWFSDAAKEEERDRDDKYRKRPERGFPSLPTECFNLVQGH
jgi:penicillin-insensitive murein DD-endopeptidase